MGDVFYVLTKLARAGLSVAVLVLAGTTFALAETSATPAPNVVVSQASPAPTASPNPFTWSGYVRAYDFYRQNAYGFLDGKNAPGSKANQQSENNAISLSGQYAFLNTGFSVGASYLYANPLNGCTTAASALYPAANSNQCYQSKSAPAVNPDTTLPQFEMSTLYQAYLQYKANGLYFKGGDQVINTPWAPSSDSRLKPVAYQGVDLSYKIAPQWTIEGSDYWNWECRTCSNFDNYTLLTDIQPGGYAYSGANAYPSTYYDPSEKPLTGQTGFTYGRLGYSGPKAFPLAANVYYYGFTNIANALWVDAKYPLNFTGRFKAFLAAQGGSEANAGTALLGTIDSQVYGVQAGFNPLDNVTLTGGFDTVPWKSYTLDAAQQAAFDSNFTCSAGAVGIAKTGKSYHGNVPYFLPTSGTGNCRTVDGSTTLYYGGWASPYTDSYATDPLFTTGGTQGMIDRRSAGASFKVAATFTSADKQFVATVAQEWYDYNNPAYAQATQGTDFDTQYFFSHIPKSGPYHGLSLRVRLFSRSESDFVGGSPDGLFKYSRIQAEYDF